MRAKLEIPGGNQGEGLSQNDEIQLEGEDKNRGEEGNCLGDFFGAGEG